MSTPVEAKTVEHCANEAKTRAAPDADDTSKKLVREPYEAKKPEGVTAGVHRNALMFAAITPRNVGQLRVLNYVCFPIDYSNSFYTNMLRPECLALSFYACDSGDVPVGAITCRPEKADRVYLMTLSVLQAYRRMGIGAALLQELLDRLSKSHKQVKEVVLHVHTPNEGAVAFYQRFGFEVVETLDNYYNNLEPKSAYYLRKKL